MGNSKSSTTFNTSMGATESTVQNILNQVNSTTKSSQQIVIEHIDAKGNIIIKGQTNKYNLKVNTSSLFTALAKSTAQQDLSAKLTASSKAVTSQLNLLNFSDSSIDVTSFINETLAQSINITNTCKNLIQSNQSIIINDITSGNNIDIEGQNNDASIENILKCSADTTSDSKASQSFQASQDVSSSAESKGINPTAILLAAGLMLIAFGSVEMAAGGALSKILTSIFIFVGPVVVLSGIVLIIIWSKQSVKKLYTQTLFATPFYNYKTSKNECSSIATGDNMISDKQFSTLNEALEHMKTNNYEALQFVTLDPTDSPKVIGQTSTQENIYTLPILLSTPNTIFFKKINDECKEWTADPTHQSPAAIVSVPYYFVGTEQPDLAAFTFSSTGPVILPNSIPTGGVNPLLADGNIWISSDFSKYGVMTSTVSGSDPPIYSWIVDTFIDTSLFSDNKLPTIKFSWDLPDNIDNSSPNLNTTCNKIYELSITKGILTKNLSQITCKENDYILSITPSRWGVFKLIKASDTTSSGTIPPNNSYTWQTIKIYVPIGTSPIPTDADLLGFPGMATNTKNNNGNVNVVTKIIPKSKTFLYLGISMIVGGLILTIISISKYLENKRNSKKDLELNKEKQPNELNKEKQPNELNFSR
tara:strand:- start:803 stop:2743 length:1941 start_codon:yes stop_codon:yes gene_type:complete